MYHERIRQVFPATGPLADWVVVYGFFGEDDKFQIATEPVVAWGIVESTEYVHDNFGFPQRVGLQHTNVQPLAWQEDECIINTPLYEPDFLGCCRVGEDPLVVLASQVKHFQEKVRRTRQESAARMARQAAPAVDLSGIILEGTNE